MPSAASNSRLCPSARRHPLKTTNGQIIVTVPASAKANIAARRQRHRTHGEPHGAVDGDRSAPADARRRRRPRIRLDTTNGSEDRGEQQQRREERVTPFAFDLKRSSFPSTPPADFLGVAALIQGTASNPASGQRYHLPREGVPRRRAQGAAVALASTGTAGAAGHPPECGKLGLDSAYEWKGALTLSGTKGGRRPPRMSSRGMSRSDRR
jgi:hypothetical protein